MNLLESFIIEAAKILNDKKCECSEGESCENCNSNEVEEASTMAGGAVSGPVTPLGAGSSGRVVYKKGSAKANPLNKSPSFYLRRGGAKKRKRNFGKKTK